MNEALREIEQDGYSIVPSVFDQTWLDQWLHKLNEAISRSSGSIGSDGVKQSGGVVYAARNILSDLPGADTAWQAPVLTNLLSEVLGNDFVLVRTLFFDKHPQRTWSLPWHKDMTIAVKDNALPSSVFSKPTCKSGVPHVEASTQILENMLTLRIHLDDVTDENGPLEVIPGSHLKGKAPEASTIACQRVLVSAGDVLAMRPLVSHASGSSAVGTHRHRRILHFEFAGDRQLPDGYQWYYPSITISKSS